MEVNFIENMKTSMLLMKNIEEKEKRHQCDNLIFNKDITNTSIQINFDEMKN